VRGKLEEGKRVRVEKGSFKEAFIRAVEVLSEKTSNVRVGMVAGQHITPVKFHLFYGFVAIIAVGILYSYRQQMRHRLYLLYGGGGLFIMGLGIRAMLVAKGAA